MKHKDMNKEFERLVERYIDKMPLYSLKLSVALKKGERVDEDVKKCVAMSLVGYMTAKFGFAEDDALFLYKKLCIMTKRLSAESLERLLLMFSHDRT